MQAEDDFRVADALKSASDDELFAELINRGFKIGVEPASVLHPKTVRVGSQVDPEAQWLLVWEDLRRANQDAVDSDAIGHLCLALDRLFALVAPPSVRYKTGA